VAVSGHGGDGRTLCAAPTDDAVSFLLSVLELGGPGGEASTGTENATNAEADFFLTGALQAW